jgi:hypothetical protein
MRAEAADLVGVATPLRFSDVGRQREAEFKALEEDYYRARNSDRVVLKPIQEQVSDGRRQLPKVARRVRPSDGDAWIEAILDDQEATVEQAQRVRHHDTIGVYAQPEPKSLLSPAPKSRLRFEPPTPRYNPNI